MEIYTTLIALILLLVKEECLALTNEEEVNSYDYPSADPPKPGFLDPSKSKPCRTCPWNRAELGPYPKPFNVKDKLFEPTHRGRYFDVYGHWIETHYSEVYWTAQPAVPLPEDIVSKFEGRAISITGFETDVVAGGENENDPEWSVPEYLVYNHHYNAVLNGKGAKMTKVGTRGQDSLLQTDSRTRTSNSRHAIEIHPAEWEPRDTFKSETSNASNIPTSHILIQGNGGEHRKSFKYLPRGTGQLIFSPQEFVLQPMLINTYFPIQHKGQTARQAFYNATLPRNSLSPQGANYSGLMECPCTTRTQKIITEFQTRSTDTCAGDYTLQKPDECFQAAAQLVDSSTILQNSTLNDDRHPTGCYLVASSKGTEAYFNTDTKSKAQCGSQEGVPIRSIGSAGVTNGNGRIGIHLDLNQVSNTATITLTGPANQWFAIGFNASSMADTPYTIIIQGPNVTERSLGNHMEGSQLPPSVQVVSNKIGPVPDSTPHLKMNHVGIPIADDVDVLSWQECRSICRDNDNCYAWTYFPTHFTNPYRIQKGTCRQRQTTNSSENGFTADGWIDGMWSGIKDSHAQLVRTVVLTRSLRGVTPSYYTFDPSTSSIPYIEAVGTDMNFGYHGGQGRGGGSIVLVQTGAPICICRGTDDLSGSINGIPWADNCEAYPATTIRRDKNPSCFIDTYEGGMICCHHGIFLLDADQEVPAPTFRFRMKFRFWYEDPEKAAAVGPSVSELVYPGLNYQNAFFLFRENEMAHGEYDVPACVNDSLPKDCVHVVEGHFQIQDTIRECQGRSDVWCAPSVVPEQPYPMSQYVALVHISTHCHGPACISMEMINADTNETICYTEPHYGVSDNVMDEVGYAAGIPPCLWGSPEEGLPFPPVLSLKSNITIIKKVNSTVGHRGVMGHWQMRGIWAAETQSDGHHKEIETR